MENNQNQMQNNDPKSLYMLTKKTNISNLIGSKVSKQRNFQNNSSHIDSRIILGSTLSNSQNSQRKTSFHVKQPLTSKNTGNRKLDTDEGSNMKHISSYQNINHKMEQFSQQKKNQISNFFEGIYLIGNNKQCHQTTILYKYGNCNFEQLLPDLLFPYGANEILRQNKEQFCQINQIFLKHTIIQNNVDCFVIPIKTSQSFEKAQFNSNELAYCICVKIEEQLQTNNLGQQLISEKILCLITYFPLIKYFMDFLIEIINCFKQQRIPTQTLEQYIKKCTLIETLPIQIPSQQIPQQYYDYNDINCKTIKILSKAQHVGIIGINILLERTVIFLSPNVQQLGSIIMLFLKHIKWIHQMVASIPPNNIELLNLPVPLLGGIVIDDHEYVQQLIEEHSNLVFVDLFNSTIWNSQDFKKSLTYINIVKKLQGKLPQEQSKLLGDMQQDLVTERNKEDIIIKEFQMTQYYFEMNQVRQSFASLHGQSILFSKTQQQIFNF